jgi:Zn finger protein HypA/HybF involved in hydrogenase expression
MHDTFLIKKISEEVLELCKMNKLNKLTKLVVTVNHDSHVDEENLNHQLHHMNKKIFGEWTHIQVLRDDIQAQTAILQTIEGEKSEG